MKALNFTFILISLLFTIPSYAQQPAMFEILGIADIFDNAESEELFEIPELKSKDGALEVHLFMDEDKFILAGDSVKLRSYSSYESGGKYSSIPGPYGPTLRINPSDRLTMIVHNDLPAGPETNYLGSITADTNMVKLFEPGAVSNELSTALIVGTDGRITCGHLKGAITNVVKPKMEWEIFGREPCECPPGMEGTCEYQEITYIIKKMWNPGTEEKALRIYELKEHTGENHNIPHGFNTTNMHAHGFHVSPFQDDIFRTIEPGFASYYTYDLEDHTPGTMWYHPHVHGSTALQVASGMSGVIIIEDGDLSSYPALAEASKPDHEKVLVFNQIIYDEEIRELPDFNTLIRSSSPKGTTVNGKAVPVMPIQPGEVQRWRMVHSGYHALLGIYFPSPIEVYQIAIDGIMFEKPRKLTSLHMAPGNRSDILIRVPANLSDTINIYSVKYNLDCEYFPEDPECAALDKSGAESLMKLVISGDPMDMKFPSRLPGPGPKHTDIKDAEISNLNSPRKTNFNIEMGGGVNKYVVNGEEFEGDTIHEILTLDDAEVWELSSSFTDHPYHIHINPFQVTEIIELDTNGNTIKKRQINPPIWKDVALVNKEYKSLIRTRYQKYWGDFVMHCHVLHHEDQGMMQRIRIERPVKLKTKKKSKSEMKKDR